MGRERLVVQNLAQAAVRLVVDSQPPLFLDDLALGDKGVLVDPKRRHSIGFQPQRQGQVLSGHRLPEHRRVFLGVGVAQPAHRRDERGVLLGTHVLGAFEHQVLEEVGEPGPSRLLVLRAHVIPELHVDDRRRMILGRDDGQAVRKRRDLVLQLRRPDGSRGRTLRNDAMTPPDRERSHRAPGHDPDSILILRVTS